MNMIGWFLTATALLIAILLVWAQLWANTYTMYVTRAREFKYTLEETKGVDFLANLGLAWIYLAILFALIAFAFAAWNGFIKGSIKIPSGAVAFLGASLSMTAVQLLQSFSSAFFKFWKDKTYGKPFFIPNKCLTKGVIVGLPVVFLAFSIGATLSDNRCWWIGNLVFIGAVALAFVYRGVKWK